ncbi:MAG: thiamine diphosphokinase [Balneolaceae bacterium]
MQAVIICDGRTPPAEQLLSCVDAAGLFVAADGGGNRARTLGLTPDVIIGDLDSYRHVEGENIPLIHDRDQESNDLEKALSYVLQQGAEDVTVFGALGKRLDHTLKNLSVLKKFHSSFRSLIYIDRYGYLRLLARSERINLKRGTQVSLFPLSGKVSGIETTGLKYPLSGESLENGVRDGTSNEATEEAIEIRHRDGDLLIFIETKEPDK